MTCESAGGEMPVHAAKRNVEPARENQLKPTQIIIQMK